jgi:hypothetical protein
VQWPKAGKRDGSCGYTKMQIQQPGTDLLFLLLSGYVRSWYRRDRQRLKLEIMEGNGRQCRNSGHVGALYRDLLRSRTLAACVRTSKSLLASPGCRSNSSEVRYYCSSAWCEVQRSQSLVKINRPGLRFCQWYRDVALLAPIQ